MDKKTPKINTPDHRADMFDLPMMLENTGRDMIALAERMNGFGNERLTEHDKSIAKLAITGRQLQIVNELAMFCVVDSRSDIDGSYSAIIDLLHLKSVL